MRNTLLLALLSCSSTLTGAISLEKCNYRVVNMQHTEESFRLAIVDCDFNEDLYMKSRLDGDLLAISSSSSKKEVAASIADSEIVSSVPWANFAGLTIDRDSAVPNSLFSYSGVKLSCQHEGIDFQMLQRPSHEPPIDFLYSLPPTKNSINELWQAFGAYKWPENPIPRRMSVGLMVDAGFLSQGDLDTCIDHGKLVMSADTSPIEACPHCSFVPTGSGCSEDECSIWHYSDSQGKAVNPLSSAIVERADHECNLETFVNFTESRLPQLYELLETSSTEKESNAAMLSYTTIVNNIDYVACREKFDSFYTTKSASVFMKGVRGCEDPTDQFDPCCNEAAQWSDCCLAKDKHIQIDGVFKATNLEAIQEQCGTNSNNVAALLGSEISAVLISTSHPEFGCNAAYEKVVPKHGDQSVYRSLWDESPVSKCEEEVRWGKTMTGGESCINDGECWSGSCLSDGSQKRCTRLYGEAVAGPLLSCVLERVDSKIWKYMTSVLNIDPSEFHKGVHLKGSAFDAAVEKFKKKVGSPNCVGEEAERGICAIIITKEECLSINHIGDWSRKMEWVVDKSSISLHGGFCKKRDSSWFSEEGSSFHVHGHTESTQAECKAIFNAMQGACPDSSMPNGVHQFKPQSECTGETESWFDFASHTVEGYRLVTQKIHVLEETSGNWVESVQEGDKDKCLLQSTCNWDPDDRITAGSESLCLDPSPLESTTYPRASFAENGSKMTCLQCWGSRCEDFRSANPPICAVRPHSHDDCAENSGGGPNNDDPVTMMTLEGEDSHMKCRRKELTTKSECLPTDFCPLPVEDDSHLGNWLHHCAESSCWDLSKDEESCHHGETAGFSFGWNSDYRGGEGLCRVHDREGKHFDKSFCEASNFMWWEGRAFKPGQFNTKEECSTFCNDGVWPIQKTCSSGSCNEHCSQCVESNSYQFPTGAACYLEIAQNDCFSLGNSYEFEWSTQLCYRKNFSGGEADCIFLDQSGTSYDDSLSMSMIFDFDEAGVALTHSYVSCPAQSKDSCSAYCLAQEFDDYTSCQDEGLEWDWSLSLCKHPTWKVNRDSSPMCESYVSGLDENSSEHDRWQYSEKCWFNGCHFEAGHVGFSAPTCAGDPKGCAQQQGTNIWVDGGGDDSTSAAKILLGCRWDMWRSCPNEETCLEAGECSDWFLGNESGKCIVPLESNEWGHRKGCHEVQHSDGTRYDYADKLGCVARKTEDGMPTNVKADECSSVGGTWHVRANSKETCEEDRGNICTHPFDDWRIFGGIKDEDKCDTCGYVTTHPTEWAPGIWSTSAETPLYWAKRSFSTKNKWEENSFDSSAFHALIRNSISRYLADAFKSKVFCELGAYNAFVPVTISMCSADDQDMRANVAIKYDLTTSKVSCGDLQDQPPMETYDGSISYANAECTDKEEKFAEATMGKVVPLTRELGGRRTATSSSVCHKHAFIENSSNAVVGQKLGNGLSVTNVSNATICIKPTVHDSEICSEYVEFGIATVDDSSAYSVPLETSATINQQGEVCFDGSKSEVTYVPVKLLKGWQSVSGATPSTSPVHDSTITPSTSPISSPTLSPNLAEKEDNSASSILCISAMMVLVVVPCLFSVILG